MNLRIFILVVLCLGLLMACGTPEATPLTSPLPTSVPPTSVTGSSTEAPATLGLPQEMLVPFRLEKPLHAGDTHVRGSGPPGVPIVIANVTLMGEPQAYGEIGPDGQFDLSLPNPLEQNYRIGLALGDLTGKPWTEENFRDPLFNGDEPQTVPQAGFYYDTSLVVP